MIMLQMEGITLEDVSYRNLKWYNQFMHHVLGMV